MESLSVLILYGYSANELGHWIMLKCGNVFSGSMVCIFNGSMFKLYLW